MKKDFRILSKEASAGKRDTECREKQRWREKLEAETDEESYRDSEWELSLAGFTFLVRMSELFTPLQISAALKPI